MKYIILLLMLFSCKSDPTPVEKQLENEGFSPAIKKFTDKTNGITCYTLYQNSISCVKDPTL